MSTAALGLIAVMVVANVFFVWRWYGSIRVARREGVPLKPDATRLGLGFVTNFFDTLGIGSFAPTTAFIKLRRMTADELIPGTLNVGHAPPTLFQAAIFISAVALEPVTLVSMIAAAVLGAWLGAGVVSRLSRRKIQIGMGTALTLAAVLLVLVNFQVLPGGGSTLQLTGGALIFAVAINFLLGALMTLGIGLYAPCLIVVSLLGMNPIAAFPIMMGSCGLLMPVAGIQFVRSGRYDMRIALGLVFGGIPAVFIAAFVVKSLPLGVLRWLVVVVALYAAVAMLRSAFGKPRTEVPA